MELRTIRTLYGQTPKREEIEMAIFRAGKRIGNMDIRIGLPRDKSLDNVEGDKRLKEKFIAGNRSVSTLNRFMAEIAKGEGVARANRFLVRFYPPRDVFKNKNIPTQIRGMAKQNLINNEGMRRSGIISLDFYRIIFRRSVPIHDLHWISALIISYPGRRIEILYYLRTFSGISKWISLWKTQIRQIKHFWVYQNMFSRIILFIIRK